MYKHEDMPPVVRRVEDGKYVLETQTGTQVGTYSTTPISQPEVWFTDYWDYMKDQYSSVSDLAHDYLLLSMSHGWEYVDAR